MCFAQKFVNCQKLNFLQFLIQYEPRTWLLQLKCFVLFCFNQRNSLSQGHLHSEVCSYFALGQLRTKSEKVHCLFLRSANQHVTNSSLVRPRLTEYYWTAGHPLICISSKVILTVYRQSWPKKIPRYLLSGSLQKTLVIVVMHAYNPSTEGNEAGGLL